MIRIWRTVQKHHKPVLMLIFDLLMLGFAFMMAMAIRVNGLTPALQTEMLVCLALTLGSSSFIFLRLGLYRTVIRYMGQQAIVAVLQGLPPPRWCSRWLPTLPLPVCRARCRSSTGVSP
ncbi:hypothetical protein [Microbulbifer taiwanensis]|uniref:hypothetical protein n=1 Tax=Microbulbifer taiwanensis TaxID=986746 RepID=UPI003621D917